MSDDVNDVRRVLTMAFRSSKQLNPFDLERWLAFDMGWLAPHESEDAVAALVAAGWLTESGTDLEVAVPLGPVEVPLGWFPRPSRLLQPVQAAPHSPHRNRTDRQHGRNQGSRHRPPMHRTPPFPPDPPPRPDPAQSTSTLTRACVTQRLVKFIARTSGIDATELNRRAERKQKAFRHVTPWLALALVAREQNLDMEAIVEALAVV